MGETIKSTNYLIIEGWMRTDLHLKGNELIAYALIYGFSQDGVSDFCGSARYIAEWAGVRRETIVGVLKRLGQKGLIEKQPIIVDGVTYNRYKVIAPPVRNSNTPCAEIAHPPVRNSNTPCAEIAHPPVRNSNTPCAEIAHNILDNIIDNNIEDKDSTTTGKNHPIDYSAVVDDYNRTCTRLPKVVKLSDSRKRAIRARLNSYTVGELHKAFVMAQESDFLCGQNKNNWHADFDWILSDKNLAKLFDGKYANRIEGGMNGANYDSGKFSEFTV